MLHQFWKILGKLGPFLALILLFIFFSIYVPEGKFYSKNNLGNIISQTAVVSIAAVGMTFIIVSAGIDLSVGSTIALSGTLAAMFVLFASGGSEDSNLTEIYYYLFSGILVAIVCGAIIGAANGGIITMFKLPPFIVTLGMLEIVRGTALLVTNGLPVSGLPNVFTWMGNATIDKNPLLPYSLFILIPVALLGEFLLRYTVFGVQVYAVGSNEQTARLCGINVSRVKLFVYMIGGLTGGLAGYLQASRLYTGQPTTAQGMELDVIAAVVVGGGSLMGGEGTIIGTIIGAFIIQILRNGLNLMGIQSFTQRIFIGSIIIIAVLIDQLRRRSIQQRRG